MGHNPTEQPVDWTVEEDKSGNNNNGHEGRDKSIFNRRGAFRIPKYTFECVHVPPHALTLVISGVRWR